MKQKTSIFYGSLLAMLACMPNAQSAGIRVGNLSRSNAQGYQQVNDMRYNAAANTLAAQQAAVAAIPVELPVTVSNPELAEKIRSGDADTPVTVTQLERCSMIYPNGQFEWAGPTIGRGVGGASTCTAVIEMRAYQAGPDGKDLVVARANLSAGESIRCNIEDFPAATWLEEAGKIKFPADNEPTMEDVIEVMNQEQKQDAGLKIAAGAVLFGVAGNMIGKNEPGKTGLLGGGEDKLKTTAIGALGGAALMVGHTQTGKIAGDTILSAGVNATAGAVVGNMVAAGDAVLRIEDCIINGDKKSCIWGYVAKGKEFSDTGDDGKPQAAFYNIGGDEETIVCKEVNGVYQNCEFRELISIELEGQSAVKNDNGYAASLEDLAAKNYQELKGQRYELKIDNNYNKGRYLESVSPEARTSTTYVKIKSAKTSDKKEPALIAGVKDKAFGYKKGDWDDVKKDTSYWNPDNLYLRNDNNEAYKTKTMDYSLNDFYPMYRNAQDGNLIDFGNKARLKSTLTGAGIGGAMGAFSGYQGAKKDVEERWVTAVREYKDSLSKVYCGTGARFLSQYNDIVTIPAMSGAE